MKTWIVAALASTAAVLSAGAASADEGMWTFDNFPSQKVKAEYGVEIGPAWLARVQGAAARLSSGCSSSIVSGDGLVLTNHHCVRECAQNLSDAQHDYVKDGFMAVGRNEELLCPGMVAEVLDSISDATTRVNAATAGKTGQDFVKARDGAIAAIEKEGCAGREGQYRCQVISLYEGGQYKLYTYRKYSDVRLVFAPEAQITFFGGDPDNFNFPRYDLDFSFLRLYESGKPVVTPSHLTWTSAAPKDGEPVFVAGNPGYTERLLTAAELATLRDQLLPDRLYQLSELRGRLIRFSEESAEHQRIADDMLFGVENSFKALHGQEQALALPKLMAEKTKADEALRARVMANPKLKAEIGDPWTDIAKLQEKRRALAPAYSYEEASSPSILFGYARALVRAAAEREKPNNERLPSYTDSRLPLVEKTLLDKRPVYPELEQLTLEFWLSKLRENLTADAEGTKVFLGKESPETLAAQLATSKLGDPALRKALWEGGMKAIEASDDPMIRYVLRTDPASRAIRRRYETEVGGPSDRAAEKIAKARFAIYGTKAYPDATFSLRLSYGKVAGWRWLGQDVPPFTYLGGLWDRATGHAPFDLPPRWQNAKSAVDPNTVFDFTTNNDIIGGNSGSPAIDAKGQVIGAIFDGNIHSLGGAFYFDPASNRAVAVSTAAITEALTKVYKDDGLVKELMGN